jgi:hypothetical protein
MRPVEILTKNLCQAGFDTLMAELVFQSVLRALQAQNTCVADQLYRSLAVRYQGRRNIKLISALQFLTDPVGYRPNRGSLEICDIRDELKDLSNRLYPTEVVEDGREDEIRDDSRNQQNLEQSYARKLADQFQADLAKTCVPMEKKLEDIDAEMALAAKTGELTSRLRNLREALQSIPASSVASERAFSTAGRFITKIRNRLGDRSLDNFCFARSKLAIQRQVILLTIYYY